MRKVHRSKRYVAVLLIFFVIGSMTVGAKELLRSAGIIGSNKDEIMQQQIGHKAEEDFAYHFNNTFYFHTDLISTENLYEENIPIAKYIVEIPLDIEGKLPEYYLDNGAMIIFTQSNNAGWNVAEDTMLHFEFTQGQIDGADLTQPGILEVGYILNGELKELQMISQNLYSVDFCPESEGTYYFYLKNCSSNRIIISEGNINAMRGGMNNERE
ncbi:MAG: hypothetical protein K2M46_05055 [Lachnospiraceae bacterium]|nr:hypothetical protein [Lachnospiraceae bacterium]